MVLKTIKINQLAFIKNFIIKKKLIDYNANIILIKAKLAIKILDKKNYSKTDLQK